MTSQSVNKKNSSMFYLYYNYYCFLTLYKLSINMRRRLLPYALLLTILISISSLAYSQENYEVRKVTFKENKTLKKDFLLDKMAMKEVSSLGKLLTKKEPFLYNTELVNADIKRLVAIYQSDGFIDASATLQPLIINDKKKTVKIVLDVEEGKPILIDTISFHINSNLSTTKIDSISQKMVSKLSLLKNKRFRDQNLLSDITIIEDAFQNLGYLYVKVDYTLDLDLEQYLTGIKYIITPGEVCYVGKTTIDGEKRISEKLIRKQLSFKEGEIYNKSMLAKTRENLYNLQLFKVVSVLPSNSSDTLRNQIPINIYIEEANRFSTKFGVGYGTEDKFRAFAELNFKGFLGEARRLNLQFKHSGIMPYSANLRWIQPHFLVKNGSIVLNPFIERKSEPAYEIRTYGLNIPINYQINKNLSSTLTYYYENVKQKIEEGDYLLIDPEDKNFLYNKSGVLISALFNSSKPQFSPVEGTYLSLGYKLNGYIFGGKFNYGRIWSEFRQYKEMGDVVLAFRAMIGGIYSKDNAQFIPVEDRFYSGGSNSVRGWNRSELGPKRESGTPLGGKSIIEANIEARVPLFWLISGVVFIDTGNVWSESFRYRLKDLAYAIGGGIRIKTPIGPIRFDVGFPVGNEKKSPQFFISVGQAF